MKHTPGPWIAKTARHSVTNQEDPNALDVFAGERKIHHGTWGGMADSRLIAAAPELLAQLKSALLMLETVVEVTRYYGTGSTQGQIEALIARIEGNES